MAAIDAGSVTKRKETVGQVPFMVVPVATAESGAATSGGSRAQAERDFAADAGRARKNFANSAATARRSYVESVFGRGRSDWSAAAGALGGRGLVPAALPAQAQAQVHEQDARSRRWGYWGDGYGYGPMGFGFMGSLGHAVQYHAWRSEALKQIALANKRYAEHVIAAHRKLVSLIQKAHVDYANDLVKAHQNFNKKIMNAHTSFATDMTMAHTKYDDNMVALAKATHKAGQSFKKSASVLQSDSSLKELLNDEVRSVASSPFNSKKAAMLNPNLSRPSFGPTSNSTSVLVSEDAGAVYQPVVGGLIDPVHGKDDMWKKQAISAGSQAARDLVDELKADTHLAAQAQAASMAAEAPQSPIL